MLTAASYAALIVSASNGPPANNIGTDTLFLVAMGVVFNDIGAYFVGSAAGRTPLRPWISPNKTVEGLIGGTIGTIAAVMLASVPSDTWTSVTDRLLLAVVIAVLAPLGDLFESAVKRNLDVKDFGTAYVEIVRNTPLTLVFIFFVFVAPQIGLNVPFFTSAVFALSVYTAAFVCEAVRSGVNSVGAGQTEAARAIGLTFTGTLRLIVLPQALRSVVPPLINIFIALTKNSSVAGGFFVAELFGVVQGYRAAVIAGDIVADADSE